MRLPSFNPTMLALLIAGIPVWSQAALYTVERVDNLPAGQSAMAKAISPDGAQLAINSFSGPVGVDFGQELPFMTDMEHFINGYDDIYNYCRTNLNYSTCDVWTNAQYYGIKLDGQVCTSDDPKSLCLGGFEKQLLAWTNGYTSNQVASTSSGTPINPFTDTPPTQKPTGDLVNDSTEVVVRSITDTGAAIGASSSPYFYNGSRYARAFIRRGFNDTTMLLPPSTLAEKWQPLGQTNAYGAVSMGATSITYGSASVALLANPANGDKTPGLGDIPGINGSLYECINASDPLNTRNCQYLQFANQAAIWVGDDVVAKPIAIFPNGTYLNDNETAQAAVQSAASVQNQVNLVGFSSFGENGNLYAAAVLFKPKVADLVTCIANSSATGCWDMVKIPGIDIRQGDNIIYTYTKATGINTNGLVIGEVKNANPINGSLAEYIFVYDSQSSGNAVILGAGNSPLFFNGYNATAASVNTNGEIVGKVDVEMSREKERRQRAYIYLHGNSPSLSKFDNVRAWLLDDLTNDGVTSGAGIANEYRIAEAFDINENGDIAASAFYCPNGYETLAQDARCAQEEQLVAVKLTPKAGTIQKRSEDTEEAISRSGGAIGVGMLALLCFASFTRRRKA